MSASNPVPRIYRAVIDDVIKNVKESFLNEGVDEQVLTELKQLWESKLLQSRAIDFMPSDVNVRVSLTYPHSISQIAGINQQAGSSALPQRRDSPELNSSSRIMQSQTGGPFLYVSNHPTLGNVGPMSDAAAQASLALQNAQSRSGLTSQQNPSIQQAQQVLHMQQNNQIGQHSTMFPVFGTNTRIISGGPRVIYTPQQSQQSQHQVSNQKQHVIQVDGQNDEISISRSADSLSAQTSINKKKFNKKSPLVNVVLQLDGTNDSSSEEEIDEDDDDDDDDDEDFDNYPIAPVAGGNSNGDMESKDEEEEEPLNSEDDVSDEDPTDLFDTENVVVCQYDKIARTRNRWKFHLKDGIMNLRNKDFVFHKANGDSEW
ncbi:transcription initiation factor IIA subunit 1 isoform X1 [Hydra vulgaris]|uniref:Transcription initiation factor IIA subunit 1 isoform X1 n=2 Tax=Hydra vulgaris TaxID=6087 RepID=A0ABM4DE13_HYDVU